eukprot:3259268-Rhodomonas_salina.1
MHRAIVLDMPRERRATEHNINCTGPAFLCQLGKGGFCSLISGVQIRFCVCDVGVEGRGWYLLLLLLLTHLLGVRGAVLQHVEHPALGIRPGISQRARPSPLLHRRGNIIIPGSSSSSSSSFFP